MKTSLKLFTAFLLAGTFFLNLSFDSSGHFSLFKKAEAVPTQKWAAKLVDCVDHGYIYGECWGCFNGQSIVCFPTDCPTTVPTTPTAP